MRRFSRIGRQAPQPKARSASVVVPTSRWPGRTVSGQTNNNGNDGTVARFGWKAQNKSLLIFAGEAYNVEMGITNDLFMTEREETAACQFSATPNSITDTGRDGSGALDELDREIRDLHAPPRSARAVADDAGRRGLDRRRQGALPVRGMCALPYTFVHDGSHPESARCRTSQSTCSRIFSSTTWVSGWRMASARAAPVAASSGRRRCGALGQRLFFLHDGRAADLVTAIRAHASAGSEANVSVANYASLSERQKQDLLNFLRSL